MYNEYKVRMEVKFRGTKKNHDGIIKIRKGDPDTWLTRAKRQANKWARTIPGMENCANQRGHWYATYTEDYCWAQAFYYTTPEQETYYYKLYLFT